MSAPHADRNLLYGVLALQMDFITRDALLLGMNAWVLQKHRPLGEVLLEQGGLKPDLHELLEVMVRKHLEVHHNDPQQSLASVHTTGWVAQDLQRLGDADVQASLARVGGALEATRLPLTLPLPGSPAEGPQRFPIVRFHARGGLGQVFVARDSELKREVALKQIQDRFADDPHSRARFVLEAEVTGSLEHPGVVPVYGLGRYPDGRPFYAMRFVKGESFKDAIDRFHQEAAGQVLELRRLLGRFVDVCNAVAYAHSRGILHRDLKPGNVLLGKYGETLVVDWGLAKLLGQAQASEGPLDSGPLEEAMATQAGGFIGTPSFASPEQAAGQIDRLGPASDVYSLGATLYCLLTGQPPAVAPARPVPPRQVKGEVPAALQAVCLRAMAARPEDRYATARALADDVERWLADEPVTAYREPAAVRLRRWGRRHRTLVTAAAVLLAASVLGLALGLAAVRAQKQQTEQQRDLALAAKEQAGTNLKLAREAVDRCFGLARDDPRLQGEGLKEVRKVLLASTLPFYQNFREQESADPALADRQADYLFRVGHISAELGRPAEALESYEQALAVWQALAESQPGVPRYQAELARTLINLGILQDETGRARQARRSIEQGRDLLLELAKVSPSDQHESDRARAWHALANLLDRDGQPREALKAHEEARAIRTRLARAHPGAPLIQSLLAGTLHNMGVVQGEAGQLGEGLKNLEQALKIEDRLVESYPGVVSYRASLARTLTNLGHLQGQGSDPQAALGHFDRARSIQQTLIGLYPGVASYRADLARTCQRLGALQQRLRQPTEALATLEQARSHLAKLSKDHPERTRDRLALADVLGNLAELQGLAGKPEEARKSAGQARDLLREPDMERRRDAEHRESLARVWNTLGLAQSDLGQPAEALASLEQARVIQRALCRAYPQAARHPLDLAGTCCNLGGLLRDSGKPGQSLALFDEAIRLLRVVQQREPGRSRAVLFLRNSHWGRAQARVALGRHREAAADWEQSARLDGGRFRPYFRLQQALALARAGEPEQALALVEPLSRLVSPPGEIACDLARVYALSAQSLGRDPRRPLAQRETRAERAARAALALLEAAGRAGYFRSRPVLEALKKDADLTLLRGRDDYRLFLSRIEAKQP